VKAYYHARAREYDEFWLRRGRFAERDLPGWDEDVGELAAMLRSLPAARTLDVACGTGFLTQHLPGVITGLDASDAMLGLARERVPEATFLVGDAFDLPFPDGAFERLFTSYFYCHLVADERPRFVAEARRVASELIVVGSRPGEGDPRERWEQRVLNDGSRWQVFKRVFEADELAAELGGGRVLHEGRWLVAVAA
jgi:SAM-dependent methyltransferase